LKKYIVCLGLSTEGGISELDFLENLAELNKKGGFLGSCSLIMEMECSKFYKNAVKNCIATNTSINVQIIESIKGFI
jgi:hypothetical protein